VGGEYVCTYIHMRTSFIRRLRCDPCSGVGFGLSASHVALQKRWSSVYLLKKGRYVCCRHSDSEMSEPSSARLKTRDKICTCSRMKAHLPRKNKSIPVLMSLASQGWGWQHAALPERAIRGSCNEPQALSLLLVALSRRWLSSVRSSKSSTFSV
jgi:hypothetical protein